jgi:hypothetical protein
VRSGEKVGYVRFAADGQVISEIPVLTSGQVEATGNMWRKAFDSILIMAFGG